MTKSDKIIPILIGLALFVFLGWYFSDVVMYLFFALLLSLTGAPIMRLFEKVEIKGKGISTSLAAGITLLILVFIITLSFYLIIPALSAQVYPLTTVDLAGLSTQLAWVNNIDSFLHEHKILPTDLSLSSFIIQQSQNYLTSINISKFAGNLFSFTGSVFFFVFSVLFLSYYSLKDQRIFFKMIRKLIPNTLKDNYNNILDTSKSQVVRYFNAVIIDNIIRGVMITVACWIFGIPNALLHGVIAGVLNTIPYLGSLIGYGISVLLVATSTLTQTGDPASFSSLFVTLTIIYGITKVIDTFFLQPYLFGKSVHAHPIEIFIVILCAGQLGGIVGMIFAVPAYSLLRIIINEFFGIYFNDPNRWKEEHEADTNPLEDKKE